MRGGSAAQIKQYAYLGADGVHQLGSNFILSDGHAKWFRPNAVSAGANNTRAGDCTSYQGFSPVGTQTSPRAASATCPDSSAAATFSVN
jgi:hypothetical protein